jgi:streptogramin lyase
MLRENNEFKLSFAKLSLTAPFTFDSITSTIEIKGSLRRVSVINNNYYIMTTNGVYICSLEGNTLVVHKHLFSNIAVSNVIKDTKGNLWIISTNDGVYIIPNTNLTRVFKAPMHNEISKMYLGKSNELLLTDTKQKELYRLHPKDEKAAIITFDKTQHIKYLFYSEVNKSYLITKKITTYNSIKNNELIQQQIALPSLVVKDHFFIDATKIVLASNDRIGKYTIDTYAKKRLKSDFSIQTRGYSCFYNTSSKESYFGTIDGLFVFDEQFHKKEIKFQNTSMYIKDIVSTKDGTIWCVSFKNGIYKIKDGEVIKQYTTKDGLFSNINSFIRPLKNTLWITNDNGIQQLNTLDNTFKSITKNNGLPSYDFVGMEIIDDHVYVSTASEVFSINPNTIFPKTKSKQYDPYFTSISINDSIQDVKTTYNLPNNNNKLDITFNTNGFLSHSNVKYQYRLLENTSENSKWQHLKSMTNTVTYNRLNEGSYTFQLKGIENEEETAIKELTFNVAGVFYKQTWFYILMSVFIISIFWYYFNLKSKRFKEKQTLLLEKQSKELENIYLQLESLRSQMNPHFIFNALNSIQDYIIKNEKKLARVFLVKFSRLIRMYLEHSQLENVTVSEEFHALKLYLELEKVRFEDTLNYRVTIEEGIDIETIKIPTFLIQPYVENAIKHGLLHKEKDRNLDINLSLNTDKTILTCIVKDNGIGREASSKINRKRFQYNSFSTQANEKRIRLLNKTRKAPITIKVDDLFTKNKTAQGTVVTIKIPTKII